MTAMVAGKHIYYVNAQWGARPEPADALATRWLALVERLRAVDPALAKWTHWEDGRGLEHDPSAVNRGLPKLAW